MSERQSLTDILHQAERSRLERAWETTEAAKDFAPLPSATYIARITSGELNVSKNGTPGYKLSFQVLEGEYADRRFWDDIWLTEAALPMAKRDLLKLGVKKLEQLEQPLPRGIRCEVKLALRRDDNDNEFNRVRSFKVIGIDPHEPDAFAPDDEGNSDGEHGERASEAIEDEAPEGEAEIASGHPLDSDGEHDGGDLLTASQAEPNCGAEAEVNTP